MHAGRELGSVKEKRERDSMAGSTIFMIVGLIIETDKD